MPTPSLLEPEDEPDDEPTDETDTNTMPDDDNNNDDEPETTVEETDEDITDEVDEAIDDDDVAEADLPDDDETEENTPEDDGDSGILSRINTKAVIVVAAVAVGVVIFLRFLNRGRQQTQPQDVEQPQERDGTDPADQVTSSDPLEQDSQMMDALGMGE